MPTAASSRQDFLPYSDRVIGPAAVRVDTAAPAGHQGVGGVCTSREPHWERRVTWYGLVALGLWVAWFAYWGISALGRPKPSRFDKGPSFLAYRGANLTAILLLLVPRFRDTLINTPIFEPTTAVMIVGLALTVSGLMISVWARWHLGAQWTGRVGVREGHQLVRSGPYRFVRHPIYSGLLLAFVGSALIYADWRALIAIGLMAAALAFKLQREERWMREHFAADYQAYHRQVAAIIPGVL